MKLSELKDRIEDFIDHFGDLDVVLEDDGELEPVEGIYPFPTDEPDVALVSWYDFS